MFHAAPSPMAPDALLESQWHLKARSAEPGGANVRAAWPVVQGSGIVVGVVDDGVLYAHPDLAPNYMASASYDFNFSDADPQPFSGISHGTAVAGIAAARGDNTIGVSGVAPLASLAALRLTAVPATDAQQAAAFSHQPNVIHILNNSWGPSDNGRTMAGPGPLAAAALQAAASAGRDGKGRIVVWQSGEGRLSGDDCNFNGFANSRFGIAVGALTDQGNLAPYSEGCSALMLVAPSGGGTRGITTTDPPGTAGQDPGDYTSEFTGTSAAAPAVSGAAALMLARNANLTWRDVQHILRRTAVRISPTDPSWTTGAFPHNEKLGFGLLDARAAVDMAGSWTNVPAEEVLAPAKRTLNRAIPDINAAGISDTITIAASEANFVIEHVEVDFDVTHTWRGDLQVTMTSPSGIVSRLAPIRPTDSADNFSNWRFGSVRDWGESAAGVWTLNVADRRFQDTGTWKSWTLRIYGYHSGAAAPPPGAFAKASPAHGASGQSTSPTLSWGASSGAGSYEYCIDTTNDNACSGWTPAGANTSVGLSGLAAGTSYYWQARATSAAGVTYANASATAFWSFTTASPPGAFSHSSPANGATGQSWSPRLRWSVSSGATSYEYCIDTSDNGVCNSSWVTTGGSTSADLGGLTAETRFYWHVRAKNAVGTTYAEGSAASFWLFRTMPRVRAMVDLNGDGSGDVFTYDQATGSWTRQVSLAGGGFQATTGSWSPGWTVVPAHFNTDALTDFFLFNPSSGQWFKMLNNGTGFATQSSGAWWQGWRRYVMDLDGDGTSDVFLYDPVSGQWFQCVSTDSGFSYIQGGWSPGWEILPVTLNYDSMADLFLINRTTGRWFWALGADAGQFTYPISETWYQGWVLHPGDYNGDGLTDLVLHDPPTGVFFVATHAGSGFTYTQGGWSLGWTPLVGDFDGDQADDLFLHDPATGVWFEMISTRTGGFFNAGGQTWSLGWNLHPTDVNGDGRTDMVLYHPSTGAWYQARNFTPGSFSYSGGTWTSGLAVVAR